jgi:hypothetical protein
MYTHQLVSNLLSGKINGYDEVRAAIGKLDDAPTLLEPY